MDVESPEESAGRRPAPSSADAASARRLALDHLARRTGPGGGSQVPDPTAGPGVRRVAHWWTTALRSPGRHRLVAIVLVAVLVVGAPWWWQLRRPPPAEDTLPRADRTSTSAGSTPLGAPQGGSGSPGGTAPPTGAPAVPDQVVVHVVGAVLRPGVLRLPAGSRAVDAVDAAGGLAPGADVARVNLAAPLGDGQRVVVPVVGEDPPPEVLPSGAPGRPGSSSGSAVAGGTAGGVGRPLDLNTASQTELEELPGVGPATAAAIVAHREAVGPFSSVDGLLDVRGVGPAKLEGLRDSVRVG